MTKFRDNPKYQQGHAGELLAEEFFKRRGWRSMPAYDYAGDDKAPKLSGKDDALVVPDLLLTKAGEIRWVEVKVKASATFTRLTGRKEHGIPRRHYEDYLKVQQDSGRPVWLVIYEQDTGILLGQNLDQLTPRFYAGGKMSRGGMVFFPRSQFIRLRSQPEYAA